MNKPMILLAALLAGAAHGAEPDLYIRGGFNGWGLDNALVKTGAGQYEARIVLSPGNHPFKVGSGDWSTEWVIDPAASVTVTPGAAYRMDTHPGPEGYLFVKKTAAYTFGIDLSRPAAPMLKVTRVEQAPTPAANPHRGHPHSATLDFKTFDGKTEKVTFSSPDAAAPQRSYAQSTTMQLRDPGPQHVTYAETAGLPTVRTGNLAFDALFALAGAEMKQNAVSQIRDGNYNGGAPIACECFETGEKWHYVWTRDLSYAADLGLALLDPQRVKNSLDFKLSPFRADAQKGPRVAGSADGLQIIQDTGSGGSWPVSTDRVTWAFGAAHVLKTLAPAERAAFAPRALKALVNTIENDRIAAYDRRSGLYTGEQSFLDWRDQSYAAWIVSDLASMATSKALSTNVAHYKALTLAADLARELGDGAKAARYTGWARSLKGAINKELWLDAEGMYSSLTAGHLNGAPMHKFDWLGQSLAIVTGVADQARSRKILARYPHGPMGAPVIYPQQPGQPVYHNRAIWPFVTAYGLKAAAVAGNTSVADAAYATLMRGAALNLSNMENLEWLTGQPLLLDEAQPSLIGPVINSRRQLWSVGAYLGMVIGDVFGVSATAKGITVKPFITARLRRETFGSAGSISLHGLRLHGKTVSVRIHLPPLAPESNEGYYAVDSVTGASEGTIDVKLGRLIKGDQAMRRVSADPYTEGDDVFGPGEPVITSVAPSKLVFAASTSSVPTTYAIYRDGALAASNVLPGEWTDTTFDAAGHCYAVEARFTASGNRSHHSAPRCVDGGLEIAVPDPRVKSNITPSHAGSHFTGASLRDWGRPGDSFTVDAIEVERSGEYAVQVRYHNSANQINLGISGGVKWLSVSDSAGRVVAGGVVQLPHARVEKTHTPLVYSTPLKVRLAPGRYKVAMTDFYNMSYLQANSTFTAAGGIAGPSNRFDIYGLRLLKTK